MMSWDVFLAMRPTQIATVANVVMACREDKTENIHVEG